MKKAIIEPGKAFYRRGEQGVTLVESLVAIAILGGGILTLVLAMSSGVLAIQKNDEQAVAQSLARTQMEYIKNYAYNADATTYPTVDTPDGYGVSVGVTAAPGGDGDIQKITANVTRDGGVILTAEDYKVNR